MFERRRFDARLDYDMQRLPEKSYDYEYVLYPELLTEYIMMMNKLLYKDASKVLYGGSCPTTHHLTMLKLPPT